MNKDYYEQIRILRNERLYGGEPPLERYCEVEFSTQYSPDPPINSGIIISMNHKYVKIEVGYDYSSFELRYGAVKNLGLPVSLNDVLRLLQDKKIIFYSAKGFKYNVIVFYDEFDEYLFNIDLTKPIEEQEEETLKQILELIK